MQSHARMSPGSSIGINIFVVYVVAVFAVECHLFFVVDQNAGNAEFPDVVMFGASLHSDPKQQSIWEAESIMLTSSVTAP